MARQFEDDLRSAWQALSQPDSGEGYSFVPMLKHSQVVCFAARRFPENKEALLISFPTNVSVPGLEFPTGLGFEMRKECAEPFEGTEVFSISCTDDGSLDLFETFAADMMSVLDPESTPSSKLLFDALVSRLHSWQEFMKRPKTKLLSVEEQTGLFGELVFIKMLVEFGEDPSGIISAWVGPLRENQDFHIGTGAVEVKTTVSNDGFPALIQSVRQLDDSVRQPLFLGAVRLEIEEYGDSLPALVSHLRGYFERSGVVGRFNVRLQQYGYHDEQGSSYTRKLHLKSFGCLEVTEGFPRLTPASMGGALLQAKYKIDLDRVRGTRLSTEAVLQKLKPGRM